MLTEKGSFVPCRSCNTHLPKRNYLTYVRICFTCRSYGCNTCFIDGTCKDCKIKACRQQEVKTYFREKSSMLPSILGLFMFLLLLSPAHALELVNIGNGAGNTGIFTNAVLVQTFRPPEGNYYRNLTATSDMTKDDTSSTGDVWLEMWDTYPENETPRNFLFRSNSVDASFFPVFPTGGNFTFTFNSSDFINGSGDAYAIAYRHLVGSTDEVYVKSAGGNTYENGSMFTNSTGVWQNNSNELPLLLTGEIFIPGFVPDTFPPNITAPVNQSQFYTPALFLHATIQDDNPYNATWECFNQTQNYNLTQTTEVINFTMPFNLTQSCVITAYDQSNNTDSRTFTLTLIPPIPEPPRDYLAFNSCPDESLVSVLIFGMILALIIGFIVIAKVFVKVPMVSIIACMFLMFPAGVLLGCSRILGLGVAIFSILLMVESAFNG